MQAWAEIDLGVIEKNTEIVRKQIGADIGIIGVIKSDAYGHGIARVAPTLEKSDVSMLATISLEEAWAARQVCQLPIIVLGYLDPKEIAEAAEAGFTLSLYDVELAALYERIAARVGRRLRVHLAIETGMNREGLKPEEAREFLSAIHRYPHVRVEAMFSHFYSPAEKSENLKQLGVLQHLIVDLEGKIPVLPIHLSSSCSLKNFKEGYFDAVRVGLALYGLDEVLPGLAPAMTVKSKVAQVKEVANGEGVGYDHTFIATAPTTVAIISIGCADGLTQRLEGQMEVLLDGKKVPVIGKICM
ncbi:MAG TPA: alanine racemase, partial [Candidatus Saccharimonadales bacterium]|nr:alanine racemase [Candidatus Saccharimonadales bacterium]